MFQVFGYTGSDLRAKGRAMAPRSAAKKKAPARRQQGREENDAVDVLKALGDRLEQLGPRKWTVRAMQSSQPRSGTAAIYKIVVQCIDRCPSRLYARKGRWSLQACCAPAATASCRSILQLAIAWHSTVLCLLSFPLVPCSKRNWRWRWPRQLLAWQMREYGRTSRPTCSAVLPPCMSAWRHPDRQMRWRRMSNSRQ